MTEQALNKINEILTETGVDYAFMRYHGDFGSHPYWVGEYSESEEMFEGGRTDHDFILTGTTEGSWNDLLMEAYGIKDKLLNYKTVLANGHGLSITYERLITIPQDNEFIKRVQINLTIREWRN